MQKCILDLIATKVNTYFDLFAICRGYLTVILSCIYAIFILMLGVVVYIADLISRTATMAEVSV